MQIYFLLTENCNLNCSMCIRGKQHGINMDVEKLQKVIRDNDFSEHEIVITGGEPSIHSDFYEIIRIFCNTAKKVTVTSNGTIDFCIAGLETFENLFFQISLDGTRDIHDSIRGKGSFTKTWKMIQKLDKSKIKYAVASVASKTNKQSMIELAKDLAGLSKICYWRVSYEMPFGSAAKPNEFMEAGEWNCFVDELLRNARLRLKIQKIFPFELYDKAMKSVDMLPMRTTRINNCGSGKNKLYVYPTFDVYPCTCLTDFAVGNLYSQKLDMILESEKIKPFSCYELDRNSKCRSCEYKDLCNGGCIGMSYHYFGKLGMGDIRCPKLGGK